MATTRGDEVAALYPAAQVTGAEALIADPAIDLVVVATPNTSHAPLAQAALAAGKHVVIDKPLALSVAEADALIADARGRGRVLSVFHNRRWDGDFLTVERLLREETLGAPMLAQMHWDRFRPAIKPGWRETPEAGAGLLADLGPHLIDQALTLFGAPESVSADVGLQREGTTTDDYFALLLRYGRLRVELGAATLVAAPRPRFALHGTRGSFVKHGIDPQEAVLRAGGAPDLPGYGEDAAADWGQLTLADTAPAPLRSERGDWRHYYAGVAAAILDGAPAPVPPADARAGLRIIELARESAASGRVMRV